MKRSIAHRLALRKRSIEIRLARGIGEMKHGSQPFDGPVLSSAGVKYELSDKTRGLVCGGIGAFHRLAHKVGLAAAIDRHTRW